MARLSITAVLLLAAIAGSYAQTTEMPTVISTAMPTPISGVPAAAPVAAAPVAAPVPVAAPPFPISKPTFDPNLLVKPEEVTATMAFLDTVYKANPNVQTACAADKIMTDYYALSIINCDRAQSMATPGTPVTECPQACQTGVTLAGAECVASMNLAYIKSTAADKGSAFTMPDFDPTGTLAACNVVVDDTAKASAYEVGQSIYLTQALQKAGVSVAECGDFAALQTDSYAQSKIACAAAPDCNESCNTAIAAAGEACLKALATATATANPAQYAAQLQMYEKCNIKPSVAPVVVPVPAAAPGKAPVAPPVVPVSSAMTTSATAVVAAGVAAAMLLL